MMYYHTKFGHSASQNIKDMLWRTKVDTRQRRRLYISKRG